MHANKFARCGDDKMDMREKNKGAQAVVSDFYRAFADAGYLCFDKSSFNFFL